MNKLALLAAVTAVAGAAPALAQPMPMADPYGDATVAKADAEMAAGERFAQLDTDHDGVISAAEQEAAAKGPGGRGLRRADANGDGTVSRDEYLAAQASRFDMMDADHDGKLTKAERDAARQRMMQRMQGGGNWGGGSGQ